MKPQNCTAVNEPGDCYRACLATITGLSADDMPNFGKYCRNDPENMEGMWDEVREFLAPYGLSIFNNYCNGEWPLERVLEYFSEYNRGVPIILTGRPANHPDPAHAVVVLDGKIAHDPSGAGISGPCGDWWFYDAVCVNADWSPEWVEQYVKGDPWEECARIVEREHFPGDKTRQVAQAIRKQGEGV